MVWRNIPRVDVDTLGSLLRRRLAGAVARSFFSDSEVLNFPPGLQMAANPTGLAASSGPRLRRVSRVSVLALDGLAGTPPSFTADTIAASDLGAVQPQLCGSLLQLGEGFF